MATQPGAPLAATDSTVADTTSVTMTITQYNVTDTVAMATATSYGIDSVEVIHSPPQQQSITQLSEQTAENEKKLVFLDRTNLPEKDTITVIIPVEKTVAKDTLQTRQEEPVAAIKTVADTAKITDAGATPVVDTATVFKDPLPVEIDTAVAVSPQLPDTLRAVMIPVRDTAAVVITDTSTEKETPLVMINSDCRKFATEHDVDKLRVKLLNQRKMPTGCIQRTNRSGLCVIR
jgi:hypothetical protein